MNKKDEQALQQIFKQRFEEMFRKGLLQGSKAVCKVIYDKINDTEKNNREKIDEIRKFCEVSLNDKK